MKSSDDKWPVLRREGLGVIGRRGSGIFCGESSGLGVDQGAEGHMKAKLQNLWK